MNKQSNSEFLIFTFFTEIFWWNETSIYVKVLSPPYLSFKPSQIKLPMSNKPFSFYQSKRPFNPEKCPIVAHK